VFELSLLSSLVKPRKGRWSNSLLALLATGVIALVVWLVIVFFSVTEGLEKGWIHRLTAIHGEIRITPTPAYFEAYGSASQSWSEATRWRLQSIPRLWASGTRELYDPERDGELPAELEAAQSLPGAFPIEALQQSLSQLSLQTHAFPFQAGVGILHLAGAGASWTQPVVAASWNPQHPAIQPLVMGDRQLVQKRLQEAKEAPWPVVLPKVFQDAGCAVGDRGAICSSMLGGAGQQQKQVPVRVVGFYDAGVMPLGGRILFTPRACVESLSSGWMAAEAPSLQGVHLLGLQQGELDRTKAAIVERLDEAGALPCWKVETYREFEFAQELFQQFQSDRTLFSLIAIIVLAVACANIVSFLVLLVHERRREIGILRAMGASTASLAVVFGGAGLVMGLGGACIGTVLAVLTLRHLDLLVAFLSALQGHPAFHASFFGGRLPNELSFSALLFVWWVTPVLAFCSGLLPAWRACRLQPSAILKNE
jgi:ABC-type lipoprotein release transport system permease subunit